jgi:hypothetical protein
MLVAFSLHISLLASRIEGYLYSQNDHRWLSDSCVVLILGQCGTDSADDLLQCDCQTQTEDEMAAIAEAAMASPEKGDGGSESEEEEKKGFVHASQYDPTPVSTFFILAMVGADVAVRQDVEESQLFGRQVSR